MRIDSATDSYNMFEQLRRKRLLIEEAVTGRPRDRNGATSTQRRRMVEQDLQQYNRLLNKTALHFAHHSPQRTHSPNRTADAQVFREGKSQQEREEERVVMGERKAEGQDIPQERQIAVTPSVKDISPAPEPESALAAEFYELSADPHKDALVSPASNASNFFKKEPIVLSPVAPAVDIQAMEEHSSHQSEREEGRLPPLPNLSAPRSESNNNSEAIFFTSHFKELMNNELHSPRPEPLLLAEGGQKQAEGSGRSEQGGTGRFEQPLHSNPSGQSLAISNDSSLKYSLNESAIQDIITRKLSNELVVDSLAPHNRLPLLAHALLRRENVRDFTELAKSFTIVKMRQQNATRSAFTELSVNRELNLQKKTREARLSAFLQGREDRLLRVCFMGWRETGAELRVRAQALREQGGRRLLQRCFKTLKMLLFEGRIQRQIDLYFLSKVFQGWKTAVEGHSRRAHQKAYRFYFRNLKRRMLAAFLEGCYNARKEAANEHAADQHYEVAVLRRFWEAWRSGTPRQERFVRLAVTTTDLLREAPDRRLLQTRTFDFYEVR